MTRVSPGLAPRNVGMDGERLKLNELLFGCLGVLARLAAEPCCALRHVLLVPFRSFEICRLITRPSPGREEAGRRETSSWADGQTGKGSLLPTTLLITIPWEAVLCQPLPAAVPVGLVGLDAIGGAVKL